MLYRQDFFSTALGMDTYYLIALPDGAEPPLPAVLLLRGVPEEWLNGHEDQSRAGRSLLTVMQDLMQKGFSRPLAFILPRTANGSQTGFISHGRAGRPDLLGDNSFLGSGEMDRFLDTEILPMSMQSGLVREAFSLDGFSLGGASALYHALRYPTFFRSCASFDGAFLKFEFDHPGIYPETPSDLRLDDFAYLFGYPPDEAAFRQQNPLDIVSRRPRPALPPTLIHYSNQQSPTANGWRVREFLAAGQIDNQAASSLIHPASDHSWWWVDEHLYRSIPFHAHYLYS